MEEPRPEDIEVLLEGILEGILSIAKKRDRRVTYTLYARNKDGADKALLIGLKEGEAGYLKHKLQNLLDPGTLLTRPGDTVSAYAEVEAEPPKAIETQEGETGAQAASVGRIVGGLVLGAVVGVIWGQL